MEAFFRLHRDRPLLPDRPLPDLLCHYRNVPMISQVSERTMHWVRWALTIAWGLLILSLFYDPISAGLTDPANLASPLRLDPDTWVRVQGACLDEQAYPLGAPIFWGIVVPGSIFILLIFGHEFWRRICPLSFVSQIPRALGWERKRKKENKKTGKVRYELVKVDKNSWLAQNRLLVQFSLFFLGLCNRILFVNSDRTALGIFLVVTATAALITGFLYGGKTWCQYICPMAPVQKIYGEPRGLMNSAPHVGDRQKITQSMCRVVDDNGKEASACVACSSPCIDIDAERAYWDGIETPEKQWLYYGYTGLAVGYFVYYYLYSGSWNYYLSGAWAHEESQIAKSFGPGFYWFDQAVEIPKYIAAPITLAVFMVVGVTIGRMLENRYKSSRLRQGKPVTATVARHRMFSIFTVFIFNFFFAFAGKNWVALLPPPLPYLIPIALAGLSGLWLYRTWYRNPELYLRESLAGRLQKQLRKLNLDLPRFLEGRSLNSLTADEIYVLAKVLPDFSQEKRLQTYKAMLRDAIDEGYVDPAASFDGFAKIRQEFDISDQDHETVLMELGQDYPDLFNPSKIHSVENALRLESYREGVLAVVLKAWETHPGTAHIGDLLKVFSENTSQEAMNQLLASLSPEDQAMISAIRQEYGITAEDEVDALSHTDGDDLWSFIASRLGLVEALASNNEKQVLDIFQQIDTDQSGHISLAELTGYICALDDRFQGGQVEAMLSKADLDGDGEVSYDEFREVLGQLRSSYESVTVGSTPRNLS